MRGAAHAPNPQFPNMGAPPSMLPETLAAQRMALQRAQEAAAQRGLAQPNVFQLPPPPSAPAPAAPEAFSAAAAALPSTETTFVCLENMLPIAALSDPQEREDIEEDVREECGKCGAVLGVLVPTAGGVLRLRTTRPSLNRRTESARLYEYRPARVIILSFFIFHLSL